MSSLPIVKHFDIFADVRGGLLPGTILPMLNQLCLKGAEKSFHRGVVVAVPFATH